MEKKQVINDLRWEYSGPVSVEEFYAEVGKWMSEKGLQKEIKRKSEDVTSKGKKIEWVIEAWGEATHLVKHVVRLRVLFNNLTELKVKRKNKAIIANHADVSIEIDGFVETKLSHQWTMSPLFSFFRTLYDKYIWNIGMTETERNEGPVREYCYDLHKRLKAFLSLYKMKVG